jgi:hypothetical protein
MEDSMTRTLILATAAAIFAAGAALSSVAIAGGGAAPIVTKTKAANAQAKPKKNARTGGTEITEFSSSSAKSSRTGR